MPTHLSTHGARTSSYMSQFAEKREFFADLHLRLNLLSEKDSGGVPPLDPTRISGSVRTGFLPNESIPGNTSQDKNFYSSFSADMKNTYCLKLLEKQGLKKPYILQNS